MWSYETRVFNIVWYMQSAFSPNVKQKGKNSSGNDTGSLTDKGYARFKHFTQFCLIFPVRRIKLTSWAHYKNISMSW